MKLAEKVAVVTGASRRLGKEIALGLGRAGASVVVHYGRSQHEAEETVTALEALGVGAWPVQADLADPDAIMGLFAEVEERCRRLDILVNSAASFEKKPLEEVTVGDWEQVLAVNLRAPFLCVQQAARRMRAKAHEEREKGVVVNIADLSGIQAWKGYPHHGISKAGLIHFTRNAAKELAPDIRVNCIVPGAIFPPPGVATAAASWRHKVERIPLRRSGDAEWITRAVNFLVENEFLTGAILPVDGGEHLVGSAPML
jgi:NAD(P)-dependent dehydrogenase (short-subunit alcohol dehydrogenase family)